MQSLIEDQIGPIGVHWWGDSRLIHIQHTGQQLSGFYAICERQRNYIYNMVDEATMPLRELLGGSLSVRDSDRYDLDRFISENWLRRHEECGLDIKEILSLEMVEVLVTI